MPKNPASYVCHYCGEEVVLPQSEPHEKRCRRRRQGASKLGWGFNEAQIRLLLDRDGAFNDISHVSVG